MGIILVIFFITGDIYLVKIKIGMIILDGLILKRDLITDVKFKTEMEKESKSVRVESRTSVLVICKQVE